MPKATTKSYIHTLPLLPENHQSDILNTRFEAARQIYNACLGTSLKRRKKLIKSGLYKEAMSLYKIHKNQTKKNPSKINKTQINLLFKEATKIAGFEEFAIHKYVTNFRNSQYSNLIDANTAQKIASRAFSAVNEFHYNLRGRPRFKTYGQLKSVEGKNNTAGIRFIDDYLIWNKQKIKINYDLKDVYGIQSSALNSKVKYCRIVAKTIRKKPRFFLQLILEGAPKIKDHLLNSYKSGPVGIDLGPQTLAYVSNHGSGLKILASDIDRIIKKKAGIQKRLSRKLRVNNPLNFEKTTYRKKDKRSIKKLGKIKPKQNREKWIVSKSYLKDKQDLAELERVQSSRRKESHNRFINLLLTKGNDFKLEKINYKAWQKMFGKSIGAKAPGLFVELLKHKAENAGAKVTEFKTQTTACSQKCICGIKKKKSLSERWHNCDCGLAGASGCGLAGASGCGVRTQRDLFSAFLAIFVNNDILDLSKAQKAFSGIEHSLVSAILNLKNLNSASLQILGLKRSEIENLVGKCQIENNCQL